jgi:hypothetical protein
MKNCAEDESDAAEPRDYSLVGTSVVLFKGWHLSEGRCSIDNVHGRPPTRASKRSRQSRSRDHAGFN